MAKSKLNPLIFEVVNKTEIEGYIKQSKAKTEEGKTARVYLYQRERARLAYKQYAGGAQTIERRISMESYIDRVFDSFAEEERHQMRAWASIPLYFVHEDGSDNFCGFIMDRIPDKCYEGDDELNLDRLFCDDKIPDEGLVVFVKYLQAIIRFMHNHNVLLGDVLSGRNLCIRKDGNKLYPYLIDTDSLIIQGVEHPLGTYDSENFEVPNMDENNRTRKTDIYKFCLIVLRLFANPELPFDRAQIFHSDCDPDVKDDVKESLNRIEKVFGVKFRSKIVGGLSENPNNRPEISGFFEALETKSLKNDTQVDNVNNLILAIGDVRFDLETLERIILARKQYDDLSDSQKRYISNYVLLEKAEAKYRELREKEKAAARLDLEKAQEVNKLISEIGLVRHDYESSMRIEFAREGYDALTTKQKSYVNDYQVLVDAESKYQSLAESKYKSISKYESISALQENTKKNQDSSNRSMWHKTIGKIILLSAIITGLFLTAMYLRKNKMFDAKSESLDNERETVKKEQSREENRNTGASITFKDFENLGFKLYSDGELVEEGVRCSLITESGIQIIIFNSMNNILYIMPDSNEYAAQTLMIANPNPDDLVDAGNGIMMSQAGLRNMYRLASMLVQHPDGPFVPCFPEELQNTIKDNGLKVSLMGGGVNNKVSDTGIWDSSSPNLWGFEIYSPYYTFNNGELDHGQKRIYVVFNTGKNASAGILSLGPESSIGPEGVSEHPEFKELHEQLDEAMKNEGNSFDPETFKITLTSETIEAFNEVLPYLNMP